MAFTAGGAPVAPRVGYAVSRRHGGAVRRNRLRRRLREAVSQAVREAGGAVVPGAYLVRAEPEAVALPYAELVRRLGEAMRAACGPPPLARRARS